MEKKYAIWLSERVNPATKTADALLKYFGSSEAVYKAGRSELAAAGVANQKTISLLTDKSTEKAEQTLLMCEKCGVRVIPYASEEYPKRLENIYAPPVLLYAQGERLEVDDKPLVTVVGTRVCTDYGRKAAYRISYDLARHGVIVVSGLAVGIDAAALTGAVKAGGKTVGVIGCGHAINYPAENYGLRREMLKNGTVISEYPPKSKASKSSFPLRNRIMAGIAVGVLVIEAPQSSGALITAKHALEYGRDVFAVPGNINSFESVGSNGLIRDGAVMVTEASDVLAEYGQLFPATRLPVPRPEAERRPESSVQGLNEKEQRVFAALTDKPSELEIIMEKSGLSVSETLAALSLLELKGKCRAYPMKRFSR